MFLCDEDMPAVLTFAEVRDYLYISRVTLLNLLHSGELKGFKAGNQWRVRKEELIAYTKKEEW